MANAPPCIDMDFIAQWRRPNLLAWLLMALGLSLCVVIVAEHASLQARQETVSRQLARLQSKSQVSQQQTLNRNSKSVPDAERRRALGVASSLQGNWPQVLASIEKSSDESIALLSLEGDGKNGGFRLTGEARDLSQMFDFARRLGAAPGLGAAYIDAYEFRKSGSIDVVRFSLRSARESAS